MARGPRPHNAERSLTMKLGDMKVETPTPLREVEDRSLYVGSENLSQCSY